MSLKEEFQCSKLGLNCAKLSDFYKPAWSCMHQVVLLVIRGIFIVYMTVMMFLSIEQADTSSEERHDGWSPYWLIFFTSWNYLFGLLYFVMAFIISLKFLCNRSDNESDNMEMGGANYGSVNNETGDQQTKLPVYIKFFWVVYTQALSVATVVVLSYWFIIFDGELKADFSSFLTIDRHGINLLLIAIDFFLNRIPLKFLHFLYASIFMFVYLIFNLIYTVSANDAVYKDADWNANPGKAAAIFIGLVVASMFFHIIWFFIDFAMRVCCK